MTKPSRRVLLALTFSVAVACSGTPTVPLATTSTITGTVTTSAPTFTPLAGVTLTVVDGPAAGKSITTTDNGEFALSTGKGPLTVRASRDGYEGQTLTVDVAGPQTLRFTLKPLPAEVGATFTPAMGAATCSVPCRVYALPIHNSGKISAAVQWRGSTGFGLYVSLWRGDTEIARSNWGHTLSNGFFPVPITGGEVYHLRVSGAPGITSLPDFEASVLRPN